MYLNKAILLFWILDLIIYKIEINIAIRNKESWRYVYSQEILTSQMQEAESGAKTILSPCAKALWEQALKEIE